ncbi:ABC transporter permease [Pseudoflavitalea rhizosphaerae]|uniref:ABC transporter permease n=1 Tax=Pseudoflavitalea rhizosphaerae TaxID=1884793 RepID=UPI000F8C7BA3|nr:ABC transporter permease [Pseudoflavitalea rhizosphaerae]
MFRNYLITTWRSLRRSRVTSIINITGLSLGMAVVMLIALWVLDELNHDKEHSNFNTLGQVYVSQQISGNRNVMMANAYPFANELRTKYPQDFKAVALASWHMQGLFAVGDKKLNSDGMWVQEDFPSMITVDMIKGDINALKDPHAVLINESLAKSLFGDEDALGKPFRMGKDFEAAVAGVYKDLPRSSSFYNVNFLGSWKGYEIMQPWIKSYSDQWDNHSFQLFVQLNQPDAHDAINKKISTLLNPYFKNPNWKESLMILPMKDWYLRGEFKNGERAGGRIRFVWLFGAIGVFVLLLACINFMNLATARSEKRSKEVGIRKTLGSQKNELIFQFLGESLTVALISLVIALILVSLAMPWFNEIAAKDIHIPWNKPLFWSCILGFTAFTGLLAGSYPAFYLSAFNPIRVFRGSFKAGRFAALPRKILVVLQFTVSITLIIGTIVVKRQIDHARNRPAGFDNQRMVQINMNTDELRKHYDVIRQELRQAGFADDMATASSPITSLYSTQSGYNWQGKDPDYIPDFGTIGITHDYGKTVKWKILQGRDFSRNFQDSASMIVNESALKILQFKAPIGATVKWGERNYQVVGVVQDIVMTSPYNPVEPTIYILSYDWANSMLVRLGDNKSIPEAITGMEPIFKKYNPSAPFQYKFVDEVHGKKFASEERVGKLSGIFALLAILISCLGIFGLATFVAEQRLREVSIRKILGASVYSIWQLLSKDFCLLILFSFALAAPLAWYFMNIWLQDYEYRTTQPWWIFAIAFGVALFLTIVTVSTQAIKAALGNTVKVLKQD